MPKDGALLSKERIKGSSVFTISYQSNGYRVNGFLALPKKSAKKSPCIIFNRGGIVPELALTPEHAADWLGMMAEWGYVVIASNYSGCGGSDGTDDLGGEKTLNDVLNLKKVLAQVKEADTKRIGMFGSSRGGMMTYRALASVTWLKAAVSVAGVADLRRSAKERKDMKKIYGLAGIKSAADFRLRSAVDWPGAFCRKTPLLMLHGTADWRVSVLDSMDLARGLYDAKVPFRLALIEGADHMFSEYRKTRNRMVYEWFERYLKNGEELPNLKPHGD